MIKVKKLPSMGELRRCFDYNNLGFLMWKIKQGRVSIGDTAGNFDRSKYYSITLRGKSYSAHRLIYQWHYGDLTEDYNIDHIDRNRGNNKIENLRKVLPCENHFNVTGVKGVSWVEGSSKWMVTINAYNTYKYLGLYEDIISARCAYLRAKRILHDVDSNINIGERLNLINLSDTYSGYFYNGKNNKWEVKIAFNDNIKRVIYRCDTEINAMFCYKKAAYIADYNNRSVDCLGNIIKVLDAINLDKVNHQGFIYDSKKEMFKTKIYINNHSHIASYHYDIISARREYLYFLNKIRLSNIDVNKVIDEINVKNEISKLRYGSCNGFVYRGSKVFSYLTIRTIKIYVGCYDNVFDAACAMTRIKNIFIKYLNLRVGSPLTCLISEIEHIIGRGNLEFEK